MNDLTAFSLSNIRNIYCVGRNYRLHAAELGNDVPTVPMIFTKPSHAAFAMDGGELGIPGARGSVHYEAELVFAIGRAFEPGIDCDDLIAGFTVGLDLTLRDVQDALKAKGHPWLAAKGFPNSATFGRWLPFPGAKAMEAHEFGLTINGNEAQRGNTKDMVFSLRQIVDFVGTEYGLGAGDVIYTGTPAGVGSLKDGDSLDVWWDGASVGRSTVSSLIKK
ncbi:fumarylacetoacetate hydrolase family protein [Cohnella soli]|uniref:Fumarylacetoacetate hydrolase family protein n=1 Tax=Cohnella soli TaxID=425005 RepID=A0ABW0HY61_9BACL